MLWKGLTVPYTPRRKHCEIIADTPLVLFIAFKCILKVFSVCISDDSKYLNNLITCIRKRNICL